jgi:hypothetical protein
LNQLHPSIGQFSIESSHMKRATLIPMFAMATAGLVLASCSDEPKAAPQTTATVAGTTVATIPASWPTLAVGEKSERVKVLQHLLVAQGIPMAVDGNFGSQTRAGLQSFQKKSQLPATDATNTQTWQLLAGDVTADSPIDTIKAMQIALNLKSASVPVSGLFDQPTTEALAKVRTAAAAPNTGPFTVFDWLLLLGG